MNPRGALQRDTLIPIGIVGGSATWAAPYWSALTALKRGRVVSLYSPRCDEAELLGQTLGIPCDLSLREMFGRSSFRALVILETGTMRDWAIQLAVKHQIPALVADPIDDQLSARIAELVDHEASGCCLIPGLTLRMSPASLRLRELMATRLGHVQSLRIESAHPSGPHLIGWIDWCRVIVGAAHSQIFPASDGGNTRWKLTCGRKSPLSPLVVAELEHWDHPSPDCRFRVQIRCERGHATLLGESEIHWQTSSEGAQEQLKSDRTAEQVLLDLFLRRVVGGVVPIPSWAELSDACQLGQQAFPC